MINSQLFVSVKTSEHITILEQFLNSELVTIGTRVIFKLGQTNTWWKKIRANYDLAVLDAFIEFLKSDEIVYSMGNKVIVKTANRNVTRELQTALRKYDGNDYELVIIYYGNLTRSLSFSKKVSINKLERLVKTLNRR